MMLSFRFSKYLLIAAATLFCFSLPAAAATLDDYAKRIETSRLDAIALRRLEDESRGYDDMPRQKLEELRRSLPPSEQVEWLGGHVETNNQWLHDAIAAYINEPDNGRRKNILFGIEERLDAITSEIDELKKAEAAERTKDEDKQKLAEILRRAEYQKPEVKEESLFQRWYREFMEWLRQVFPKAPEVPATASGFGSLKFALQIIIYALVIGLIAFPLYRFGPLLAGRFGWRKKEKRADRVILGERIAADETAENLFGEAERLARDGQLRDAIRKGYIAALCELADRKIVRLARHKTNRDYLRDVRKTREGLFENMSGLTGKYEQNWYGLRTSEMTDWEDFRERYRQTIASV